MRRALIWIGLVSTPLLAASLPEHKVERVVGDRKFTSGALWSQDGTFLLYSDVPASEILKIDKAGQSTLRKASGGASGLAFDNKGRLYVCETHTRRVVRIDKKGEIEVLASEWQGKKLNSPNDVVVARSGHVYFTDPAFATADTQRELSFYGIFHVTPKGELQVVWKGETRPNGIALAADGKQLFVSDSDARTILAFDVDSKSGALTNERILVADIPGVPDGLFVDPFGRLYVAAAKVEAYSIKDGSHLGSFEFAEKPSSVTVGDGDGQSLYVTARGSVYRVRFSAPLDPKEASRH
jgi:gluconolactonase